MSRELICPHCGTRLPIDPKDDQPAHPDAALDVGRTMETVIPATLSVDEIGVSTPGVLLANPEPAESLDVFFGDEKSPGSSNGHGSSEINGNGHSLSHGSAELDPFPAAGTGGIDLGTSSSSTEHATPSPAPAPAPPRSSSSSGIKDLGIDLGPISAGASPTGGEPSDRLPEIFTTSTPATEPGLAAMAPFAPQTSLADRARRDVEADEEEEEESRGVPLWAILLGSYASAMTLAVFWLLWHGGGSRPSDLPERFNRPGASDPYEKGLRDSQSGTFELPPALPADRLTTLGKPLRVGSLEITPLRVQSGPIRLQHAGFDDRDRTKSGGTNALLLKVRLRNLSKDAIFAPLDEAFLREHGSGPPESFIATDHGYIGLVPLAVESEWSIVGQDCRPLKPGEVRETLIVSDKDTAGQLKRASVWRIKLRTGKDQTDVIGIRFGPESIE